jgi:spore coat protein CotH
MRALFALLLLLTCLLAHAQEIVINEFLASNDAAGADQDGEFDDWLELHNRGPSQVSLGGFYLSDDPSEPDKWMLPEVVIPPFGYLAIWADEDEGQEGLHANFKLSASGESLHLSDAALNLIDEVYFGVQTTDVSTGRYPDGTGGFIQMYPSFEAANTNTYGGGAADESHLLFDDAVVHKYELQFYTENWSDSLEYNYEHGELYMPARLLYNDQTVLDSIGVRYKGNSSYVQSSGSAKKPFKFKFNKYLDDQNLHDVFMLNFSNCIKDPSFVREKIAYHIIGSYLPSPRTAYAEIYAEGDLIGLYLQVEEIDEYFLQRNFGESGGNLFKAHDNGSTLKYYGNGQALYETEYELKTNEGANDWSDLITMLDNLNNLPDSGFAEGIGQYLDLNSCACNLAFNMVLSHFDSYTGSGRNFYLYHRQSTDNFVFLPWDLNESFGAYDNNWDVFTQSVTEISNLSQRPLNQRFIQDDTLRGLYFSYIVDMIHGKASLDSVAAEVDKWKTLIEPHVIADVNKFYSTEKFYENLTENVYIGMGQLIPGIEHFSAQRNAALTAMVAPAEVYPGDTDNNGVVNELDILPLGVHLNEDGNPRDVVSISWEPFTAQNWQDIAAAYADADGDGTVALADRAAIVNNWGFTHPEPEATYELDPADTALLEGHRSNFRSIYQELTGGTAPENAMKLLLDSIFDFESETEILTLSNSPNPFRGSTRIYYGSSRLAADARIKIHNCRGQRVNCIPLDSNNPSGYVEWDGTDSQGSRVASGVYIYTFSTGGNSVARRLVIVR